MLDTDHGAIWLVCWLAFGVAIGVLGALLLVPMGSLLRDEAGATLIRDAGLGLAAGVGVAALGFIALRSLGDEIPHRNGLPVAVGAVGIVAGLVVSFLLVGAAHDLSRATVFREEAKGADFVHAMVAIVGLIFWNAMGISLLPKAGRTGRFLTFGAFILLMSGFCLLGLSLWTLLNATELEAAAALRDRRDVPGLSLLWLLAGVALLAMARRRRG